MEVSTTIRKKKQLTIVDFKHQIVVKQPSLQQPQNRNKQKGHSSRNL